MTQIYKSNLPCPSEVYKKGHGRTSGCGSSDAFVVYEKDDGSFDGTCFSCKGWSPITINGGGLEAIEKSIPPSKKRDPESYRKMLEEIGTYQSLDVKSRHTSQATSEFFGMLMSVSGSGKTHIEHYFPIRIDGKVTGYKKRDLTLPKKDKFHFSVVGESSECEMYGQSLYQPGGKVLTIVEGEYDAHAASEMFFDKYSKRYAVVSLTKGAAGALNDIKHNIEFVNSFDKVILMFDTDEAGQSAAEEVGEFLTPGKCYNLVLKAHKDASDYKVNGDGDKFIKEFWDGPKVCRKTGIVSLKDSWEYCKGQSKVAGIPFPEDLRGLYEKAPIMPFHGFSLWLSGSGTGKSTLKRKIIANVLENTNYKVGDIALEEQVSQSVNELLNIHHGIDLNNLDIPDEHYQGLWSSFANTEYGDRLFFVDHEGSCKNQEVIDKIYLLHKQYGCSLICLDHIGLALEDESDNLELVALSNSLIRLANQIPVHIALVSQLRKNRGYGKSWEEGAMPSESDAKGASALMQASWFTVATARNKYAKDPVERNTTYYRVLKNRAFRHTGDAGSSYFDIETTKITSCDRNYEDVDSGTEDEVCGFEPN